MAIIRGNFYAESLHKLTNYTAILPDRDFKEVSVLFLLHGRSGDANSWLNQTGISRYVRELPLVVFCPEADLSYYQNMEMGGDYQDFIRNEFPEKMMLFHRQNVNKEFVAGNSMGGYGALNWLMDEPDKFTAGGLFSPLCRLESLIEHFPEVKRERERVFGSEKR